MAAAARVVCAARPVGASGLALPVSLARQLATPTPLAFCETLVALAGYASLETQATLSVRAAAKFSARAAGLQWTRPD